MRDGPPGFPISLPTREFLDATTLSGPDQRALGVLRRCRRGDRAARARAPEIDPSQADRITARIVAELIERAHLSKPEIGDEVSAKWYDRYIESLDRSKLFFTKDDIAGFEPFKDQLDDQIRRGDLSFAQTVFDRFLQRLDERFEAINALLDEGFDFEADETYVDDADLLEYPADAARPASDGGKS